MDRRVGLVLAGILVVGFALRIGYVLSQRSDLLFDHPVLDEAEYVQRAHSLADGHGEDRPYWQPPGIVYVLAATFEVAGPGLLVPRILQVLVSIASCALLFVIGRRLFDTRVGLLAAAIAAGHGVMIYECYELLPATWIAFFDLLALWLVLHAVKSHAPLVVFAAGLAIGVSAIFAPTIVPFAIAVAIVLRKPISIAALALGVLLPIVPVTLRNYDHGGEIVAISTNSGLNLYIGNNVDYRATFAMRPGLEWEKLTTEPARHGLQRAQPGAWSSYFRDKALGFVVEHPVSEVALLARKLYLFCHGAEIPRDTDLYAAREDSWLLTALVGPRPLHLPDGLLIPAALLGIAARWLERRRLALPLLLLATLTVVTVAFFVTARHRVPALPLFALFAAAGLPLAIQRWRLRAALAGAALVVALNIPTWETELTFPGELDFYRGLAAAEQHDFVVAREAFRRATDANPHDGRAWYELAKVLDGNDAIDARQRAMQEDPSYTPIPAQRGPR